MHSGKGREGEGSPWSIKGQNDCPKDKQFWQSESSRLKKKKEVTAEKRRGKRLGLSQVQVRKGGGSTFFNKRRKRRRQAMNVKRFCFWDRRSSGKFANHGKRKGGAFHISRPIAREPRLGKRKVLYFFGEEGETFGPRKRSE